MKKAKRFTAQRESTADMPRWRELGDGRRVRAHAAVAWGVCDRDPETGRLRPLLDPYIFIEHGRGGIEYDSEAYSLALDCVRELNQIAESLDPS